MLLQSIGPQAFPGVGVLHLKQNGICLGGQKKKKKKKKGGGGVFARPPESAMVFLHFQPTYQCYISLLYIVVHVDYIGHGVTDWVTC